MKLSTPGAPGPSLQADADRLADFVLFTQRSCILNLSNELNKGNVSFPQFFLAGVFSPIKHLPIFLLIPSRMVPMTACS